MNIDQIKEELIKASSRNSHEDLIRIGKNQQKLINQHKEKDGDLTIYNVVVRFLRLFKKACPNCKSRNNSIECYATEHNSWNVQETGRQCHNCNNFWYS